MKFIKWTIKNNRKRKHPALVFAESDDGLLFNLGLTHSRKRGHHKNLMIHDPTDWNKFSYVRDDLAIDENIFLRITLVNYKLHPEDYKKIWESIIIKKNKKCAPLGGSH